jgi:hypothetical protein
MRMSRQNCTRIGVFPSSHLVEADQTLATGLSSCAATVCFSVSLTVQESMSTDSKPSRSLLDVSNEVKEGGGNIIDSIRGSWQCGELLHPRVAASKRGATVPPKLWATEDSKCIANSVLP